MLRAPKGAGPALLGLCLAWCGAPAAARAEIVPREEGGEIVFTSRPERKPGAEPALPSEVGPGRRSAPTEIARLVREVSRYYDLDPGLVATVISVESGFDRMAVSPKGARGLMQLMPETARRYGVRDVHDPRENVEAGVAYLRDLTVRYNGDLRLALAAYNAGPEAVERAAGVPRFRETRDYLRKIESLYGQELTARGLAPAGLASGGGQWGLQISRDESGGLVVTNKRNGGVTVVSRRGQVRP